MTFDANYGRELADEYNQGHRAGYEMGEGERIALAQMNDKLKHLIRTLEAENCLDAREHSLRATGCGCCSYSVELDPEQMRLLNEVLR